MNIKSDMKVSQHIIPFCNQFVLVSTSLPKIIYFMHFK